MYFPPLKSHIIPGVFAPIELLGLVTRSFSKPAELGKVEAQNPGVFISGVWWRCSLYLTVTRLCWKRRRMIYLWYAAAPVGGPSIQINGWF
jgi:hypothetical protein